EVAGRDVAVLVADIPQAAKNQKHQRIDDDGVRHREERDGAGPKGERGYGDEGIRRVNIPADQEPCDHGAEAPAPEPPLVQKVEVTPPPTRGSEAQPSDETEQQDEYGQSNPIQVLHGDPL